ncbi:MAG TPA: hypothetical protein VH063_03345 [Gaiellaceae bacterium]|jgi:hypothetical protein|nr:hypothetical protein [Gaiellaceae bacterium]
MANEFSDPAWWPTPPPKPPSKVSTTKVVFGTLLPVGAAVLIAIVVLTQKHHQSAADTHSYAAFQACFEAQGGDTQAAETNSRLMQAAATACRDHLPPGTRLPSLTESVSEQEAQQAFNKCMSAATANLRGGGHGRSVGPFGGGFGRSSLRQTIEKAEALCRAIATPTKGAHKPSAPAT